MELAHGSPTGLGAGGATPKRIPGESDEAHARPPKQVRADPPKKQKVGEIQRHDVWLKTEAWADSQEESNPFARQRLASVCEWLDGLLDPSEVRKARLTQLRKLWDRKAFVPTHRSHAKGKMFHFKWVDKAKDGVHKSRLTSADVKRSYTETDKQDLRVFVPTPTPESHALLEVSALRNGYATRSFDIVAAFLIGQRAPPEWRPIFEEWVCTQPREDQHWLRDNFADLVFRLDGNLYGRRTAGSVYRDELEEILCQRLAPAFQFKRGGRDPCVYRCDKTQITLLHHVDDGRCAGPTAMLNRLIDEIIPLQAWPLECEGIAVEILGRTKTRLKDAILTALIRNTPGTSYRC